MEFQKVIYMMILVANLYHVVDIAQIHNTILQDGHHILITEDASVKVGKKDGFLGITIQH